MFIIIGVVVIVIIFKISSCNNMIRAHGLIEGDLYIGALFSIHDQVILNDEGVNDDDDDDDHDDHDNDDHNHESWTCS